MARDKKKDDLLFNCSERHEHTYVVGLYPSLKQVSVSNLLRDKCANNEIFHSTHMAVYELIESELGYAIPI